MNATGLFQLIAVICSAAFPTARPSRSRPNRRHRLGGIEPLESRELLATINITQIPTYAVDGFIRGSVTGVEPATYRVAPYIQIEGVGWWTKPFFASPTVPINADGTFVADVATGGIDNRATIFCAAIIPAGVTPPQAAGAGRIPASLMPVAIDCVERFGRTIEFAGHTWGVKEAPVDVGPGGNHFSNDPRDVFVDNEGLHLSVNFHDSIWWSTEVILLDRLGHGIYSFQTDSDVGSLEANLTFGAFTWDSHGDEGSGADPFREIDFEDSRWGNASDPTTSQFVVQPFGVAGNLRRYTVPDLGDDPALTRFFRWEQDRVEFVALKGHQSPLDFPADSVIDQYVYRHDPSVGHRIPTEGRESFRFNLWLNRGTAPDDGQPVEVVISDFTFIDTTPPQVAMLGTSPTSPSNNNNPSVTGVTELGATVRIYTSSTCASTVAGIGMVTTGTFSIPVNVADNTTTTFFGTAEDAAGNTSACSASSATYVEDSTSPAAPTDLAMSPASPANNNNPIVTGTAEPGATVRIYTSGSCTSPVAGTGTATGSFFSIPVNVPNDSTTTLFATASDAAGNVSTCSTNSTIYVEDSTALSPTDLATSPASPSNNNNPRVTGTAEAGSTVRLYTNNTCTSTVIGTGTAVGGNFSIPVNVADNTTTIFRATSQDAAGNTSLCSSNSATYVEDSAAPAAPTAMAMSPASPANNNNPSVTGTAEVGATVRIYTDNSCTSSVAAQAASAGSFNISLSVADDTITSFFATAEDAAGNISPCSTISTTYFEDSTAPVVPMGLATSPTSPANNNSPSVVGTAEVAATVRIYTDATCTSVAGSGMSTGGSFSIQVNVADNTTTAFYATATDAAGNVSQCSTSSATYVEQTPPPVPPTGLATLPASPANHNNPTVTGTAESGTTVRIY